jgi:hypothetical protein
MRQSKQPPSTPEKSPSDHAAGQTAPHAGNCRWGVPTLFLQAPYWWEAEDRPWACVRSTAPRTLEATEPCATCPYWEPRAGGPAGADARTIEALRETLANQDRTRAICEKVIEAFGPVRPFVEIMHAEERNARSLGALFARFGVERPPDTWANRVSAPHTLTEACAAAARAELDNTAMYARLLPLVRDPAVRRVMRRLQAASHLRHLPAFRRCFARAMKPAGRPRGVRAGRSGS